MTASSTIPGLFKPAKIGSAYCVDGGIGANLPTFKARQSGAQIVIAVSVDNGIQIAPTAKLSSYRFLGRRLLDVAFISMDKRLREEADIVIAPKLFGARMLDDDVQRINDSVEAGEIAARSAMPDIRKALDLQKRSLLPKSFSVPRQARPIRPLNYLVTRNKFDSCLFSVGTISCSYSQHQYRDINAPNTDTLPKQFNFSSLPTLLF